MDIQEVQKKVTPVLKRSRVQYAGIFGSVARGTARRGSDIDILVKFQKRPTFSKYLQLDDDLKKALGQDIDLVTEGAVNKFLRPHIERDLKVIYGARCRA